MLCLVQTADAQDSAKLLTVVDLILLAVEGGLLVPLAFMYLFWIRRAVAKDRANLYSIFLRVPRPTVVAMAKAEVKLLGEDGDDNDEPAVCSSNFRKQLEGANYCLPEVAQILHGQQLYKKTM